MSLVLAAAAAVLFGLGSWLLMQRRLSRIIIGLGLLPVGLAFYTWDHGVKHGDIQLLGVAAYVAPLLSTLLLIAFGFAPLTWAVVAAAVLVTAGAGLAAKDNFRKKKI